MSEVISSFKSLRAGVCTPYVVSLCDFSYYVVGKESAVAIQIALWYVVLVCYQYVVCKNYVSSVYVSGYGGLSESRLLCLP